MDLDSFDHPLVQLFVAPLRRCLPHLTTQTGTTSIRRRTPRRPLARSSYLLGATHDGTGTNLSCLRGVVDLWSRGSSTGRHRDLRPGLARRSTASVHRRLPAPACLALASATAYRVHGPWDLENGSRCNLQLAHRPVRSAAVGLAKPDRDLSLRQLRWFRPTS